MTLIINLPLELEARLQREAARKGIAAEELARTLLEDRLQVKDGQPSQKGDAWSVLKSMKGTVEGPSDWASELDRYLYGTPKHSENAR